MSATSDSIETKLGEVLTDGWVPRDGRVVPKTENVDFKHAAVKLEATYLYADMKDSTLLVKRFKPEFAARVIRMFLAGACDVIRAKGGHIRSFDGDRVMGIFIGSSMRNDATNAALGINWVVDQVINPKVKTHLEKSKSSPWSVSHCVGVDCGDAFIVRGGVRDNSDLVSVGRAPNIAAKLSAIRGESSPTIVTDTVYSYLNDATKLGGPKKENMFKGPQKRSIGPYELKTYTCGWTRRP